MILDQLLAGLAGGAQTYGQQQAEHERAALEAEDRKLRLAALQSSQDERQKADYLKGFRPGQAPNTRGILSALDLGAGMADKLGGAPVPAAQLGVEQAKAASPESYDPARFQQVTPGAYIDHTATPEAVQGRRLEAIDAMRWAHDRAREDNRRDRYRVIQSDRGWMRLDVDTGETVPVEADGKALRQAVRSPQRAAGLTAGESPDHREARQNATAVGRQLQNTRADLSAATRSTPKRPAFFVSPADSVDYEGRAREAANTVKKLRQRTDSLTGVLDQVTRGMQGGAGSPAARTSGTDKGEQMRTELQRNKARYQKLLDAGADSTEALKALQATNRQTVARYQE